jgi:hypothetical protein
MPTKPDLIRVDDKGPVERDWLIAYAHEILFEDPKIFISCSSHDYALKYRQYLQKRLEESGWEVSVYADLAKQDLTYAEAKRLITDADYLVGIWMPDEREDHDDPDAKPDQPGRAAEEQPESDDPAALGKGRRKPVRPGTAKLSPWMHFEMGLAVAFDREFKILASKSLDTSGVVRRIAGDRPVFRFKEGPIARHFGECVTSLLDFMNLNWRRRPYQRVELRAEPTSHSE